MSQAQIASGKMGFSAAEGKLLSAIIAHGNGEIDTDWDKVGKSCGYKDGSIAKTRWGQIKRKKNIGAGVSGILDFSEAEGKLLSAIMTFAKGNIGTDWDKVAVDCGYKDKGIAKTRWNQIKKKKGISRPASVDSEKKDSLGKRDLAETKEENEEDGEGGGEDGQATLAKKQKVEAGSASPAMAVKVESPHNELLGESAVEGAKYDEDTADQELV